MIFFIRKLTKNIIAFNTDKSINGLPVRLAVVAEDIPNAKTLEGYITNILMKMGHDA